MRCLLVSLLLVVGCTIQPADPAPTQCPGTPAPAPSGTVKPQPKPQGQGKACGEVVVDCNCNATNAQPGYVEASGQCQSGYQGYDICGQCPYGGYAWYVACVCE